MRHARESLHLEKKEHGIAKLKTGIAKLTTGIDRLKTDKLRKSKGFLQFWCSYKKNVYGAPSKKEKQMAPQYTMTEHEAIQTVA